MPPWPTPTPNNGNFPDASRATASHVRLTKSADACRIAKKAQSTGTPGRPGLAGSGVGGGLDILTGGSAVIDNTTTSGNQATTSKNDVAGALSL